MSQEELSQDAPIGRTLWTINQVADYLQCSHFTVRRMISAGELKAYRYGKRIIRIDVDDIERSRVPIAADMDLEAFAEESGLDNSPWGRS